MYKQHLNLNISLKGLADAECAHVATLTDKIIEAFGIAIDDWRVETSTTLDVEAELNVGFAKSEAPKRLCVEGNRNEP